MSYTSIEIRVAIRFHPVHRMKAVKFHKSLVEKYGRLWLDDVQSRRLRGRLIDENIECVSALLQEDKR